VPGGNIDFMTARIFLIIYSDKGISSGAHEYKIPGLFAITIDFDGFTLKNFSYYDGDDASIRPNILARAKVVERPDDHSIDIKVRI